MTEATQFSIPAEHGWNIPVRRWTGTGPARAAVQVAHGMAEHAGRYDATARALAEAGYAVYASDHRGHGPAAQAAGTLGDFGPDGFPALVADMVRLTRHIAEQHPGVPRVLLGHSMGSFAAQLYILDHSGLIDSVVLSGTAALDLRPKPQPQPGGGTFKLSDYNAGFEPARTPYDWLSRDAAQVDAYVADPLCGFALDIEALRSMHAACRRLSEPDELGKIRPDLPLYLFTGDRDPVNGDTKWFLPLIERYRAAGMREVSYHVYGDGRHEMLNETNRAEVVRNLIAWLDQLTA